MANRTTRRIMMDTQALQSDEMKSLRIYYVSSDETLYKGTALMFGPAGSVYEDLPIVLDITFPADYPFTNPTVLFRTTDGKTRFHPNLYVEGKVCLSILGTWQGPSWTSVMTLKTVLLSIMGLLDDEPLLHEPGYADMKGKQKSKDYTSYVEHASLQYIVRTIESIAKHQVTYPLQLFQDILTTHLATLYTRTCARILLRAEDPPYVWAHTVYSMSGTSAYKELLARLHAVKIDA